MSKMMRTNLKPPLPRSPIRLRSRRNAASLQTPPGSLTKSQKSTRIWNADDPEPEQVRSEYRSISCELRVLAKMVRDEFRNEDTKENAAAANLGSLSANSMPIFERGRFYDEYSARRNERLRRKKGGEATADEGVKGTPHNLGVSVEPTKRRGTAAKKLESLKRSVSAAYSVERTAETPRYNLRSMMKENKKPTMKTERLVMASERKSVTRRVRKN